MRVSCNVYFSYLAYDLIGFDPLQRYLDSLGFNERLRWNTASFLNSYGTLRLAPSWVSARDEIAKSRIGIGQASVKINPVHSATLLAGIANGGIFLRPSLETAVAPDTLRWKMDSSTALRLQDLLREPLKPGGTATRAFSGIDKRGITVYGKTGTADREPDGREPSWFISFGTKNGRRYAVVVAMQDRRGQYAGDLNAPIARRMYEALDSYGYFAPVEVKREE
jgi:cell division protein FtsI/penicillin-binding protein 2